MFSKTSAIALVLGSLAIAGAAYAEEPRVPAGQGTAAAVEGLMAPAAVMEQLAQKGYRDFREVELDDGKYEVEGRDAEGREVEIDVDARSGAILKVEHD